MSKIIKILKFLLIIVLIALASGCAPARKNTYYKKRKHASKVNTTQLGRNRYYFSTGYQKKLVKDYKGK
jgi:uncharacterized protein YceK